MSRRSREKENKCCSLVLPFVFICAKNTNTYILSAKCNLKMQKMKQSHLYVKRNADILGKCILTKRENCLQTNRLNSEAPFFSLSPQKTWVTLLSDPLGETLDKAGKRRRKKTSDAAQMVPVILPCCSSSGSGCNPAEEDENFPPVDFLCPFSFTYCGQRLRSFWEHLTHLAAQINTPISGGGERDAGGVFLVFPDLVRDAGLPCSGS